MIRTLMAGAVLALATVPGAALAQEGAKYDCVVTTATPTLKAQIGGAMTGQGDDASREALFKQLGAIVDGCVTRHSIGEANKGNYFDYNLARISREWLIGDISKQGLSVAPVDKAMDFGLGKTNPDLSGEMSQDQIMAIVQAYIDSGVNIEKVDQSVWEKVGAYAAATSIYWNKRKTLTF